MIRKHIWSPGTRKHHVPQYDPANPPAQRTKVGGDGKPRMTRVVKGKPKPMRVITRPMR